MSTTLKRTNKLTAARICGLGPDEAQRRNISRACLRLGKDRFEIILDQQDARDLLKTLMQFANDPMSCDLDPETMTKEEIHEISAKRRSFTNKVAKRLAELAIVAEMEQDEYLDIPQLIKELQTLQYQRNVLKDS